MASVGLINMSTLYLLCMIIGILAFIIGVFISNPIILIASVLLVGAGIQIDHYQRNKNGLDNRGR